MDGTIGFIDDYIKILKKDKEGLKFLRFLAEWD
jgi:UDP-N-acetylmuramyl pentapeptide phosphotransferase/UDP-N-acetylglucosamine-1-phosphate transferase